MPDPGPLGETLLEARDFAMVAASLVKRPSGGNVDAVFTRATQRLPGLRLDLRLRRVDFRPERLAGMGTPFGFAAKMQLDGGMFGEVRGLIN